MRHILPDSNTFCQWQPRLQRNPAGALRTWTNTYNSNGQLTHAQSPDGDDVFAIE